MKEFVDGLICTLVLIVFPIAIIVGASMCFDKVSCAHSAAAMGFDYEWGPLIGCMIKVDDKMIPIDSYKVFKEHE